MTSRLNPYQEIEGAKGSRFDFGASTSATTAILNAALSPKRAEKAADELQGSKRLIIENQGLQSRHAKELKRKKAIQQDAKRQRRKGFIGRNEAKRKGLWLPKKGTLRYDLFLPIAHMWVSYLAELLNLPPIPDGGALQPGIQHTIPQSLVVHPKLVKADFHGAIITVKDSKNKDLIGLNGIVAHETENTLKIVTLKDELKVVPKRKTIFTFRIPIYAPNPPTLDQKATLGKDPLAEVPSMEFDLYGNQFCFRSADRATRKFKHKETLSLV